MCGACSDVIAEARGGRIHESKKKKSSKTPFTKKLMALALAYKRGETKDVSAKVKEIASSMSEKDLEDFASTKHKGLPVKKEELIKEGLKAMCEACNEAIKEMYSPSRQQKQHRIYEKEMLVYSAEPMDIDIDPDVERKFNRAARNRKLAALGGLALGTGLGAVAGRKIGGALGSKGSSGFAAGYGSALGGFAGGTLGSRVGGRVADLLQAPDYAAYAADVRKKLRNA